MILDSTVFPFFISMIVLIAILLVVGVHVWRNFYAMLFVIPVSLFCGVYGYNTITDVLGYSIKDTIPDHSLYLKHIVNDDEEIIYVWVVPPGKSKPKGIEIPATKSNKQKMEQARRGVQAGIKQGIEQKKSKPGEQNDGEYIIYNFTIKHLPNKNAD